MMSANNFIARGISKKTNQFVYGYPVYFDMTKQWFLIPSISDDFNIDTLTEWIYGTKKGVGVEITQEPDKCTGLKDNSGKLIYENDKITVGDRYERIVAYSSLLGKFVSYYERSKEEHLDTRYSGNLERFTKYESVGFIYENDAENLKIKITGNTHEI